MRSSGLTPWVASTVVESKLAWLWSNSCRLETALARRSRLAIKIELSDRLIGLGLREIRRGLVQLGVHIRRPRFRP